MGDTAILDAIRGAKRQVDEEYAIKELSCSSHEKTQEIVKAAANFGIRVWAILAEGQTSLNLRE